LIASEKSQGNVSLAKYRSQLRPGSTVSVEVKGVVRRTFEGKQERVDLPRRDTFKSFRIK